MKVSLSVREGSRRKYKKAKSATIRKKKTFQAYSVALRYFFERIGNKPVKDINRADMLSFATFLREEKKQSPRSAYNKFESVMTFSLVSSNWLLRTSSDPA